MSAGRGGGVTSAAYAGCGSETTKAPIAYSVISAESSTRTLFLISILYVVTSDIGHYCPILRVLSSRLRRERFKRSSGRRGARWLLDAARTGPASLLHSTTKSM